MLAVAYGFILVGEREREIYNSRTHIYTDGEKRSHGHRSTLSEGVSYRISLRRWRVCRLDTFSYSSLLKWLVDWFFLFFFSYPSTTFHHFGVVKKDVLQWCTTKVCALKFLCVFCCSYTQGKFSCMCWFFYFACIFSRRCVEFCNCRIEQWAMSI